ncbi:MAG: helix-turn-helix domain-containing protein [Clostridia bacterium]
MIKQGALGNAIRNTRIEKNLSQEQLAELVDITPTHLKHIESEHRKPSIEVLFKLAEVLRFSIDNLIYEGDCEAVKYQKYAELLLNDCSVKELKTIIDIIQALQNNR